MVFIIFWDFKLWMDQDLFLDLGKVEAGGIKLDEAPLTAQEYLKQVICERLPVYSISGP